MGLDQQRPVDRCCWVPYHGNKGFQPRRDHGDGANERRRKGVNCRLAGNEVGNQPRRDGGNRNSHRKVLGDRVDLLENVGFLLLHLVHKGIDGADLRVVSCQNDEAHTTARCDERCAETHVATITKRRVHRVAALADRNWIRSLFNGHRLTREGRLQRCEVRHLQQADVGRHAISLVDFDQITRNEGLGWDLDLLPVAYDNGFGAQHRLERIGRFLGRPFLSDTDDHVDAVSKRILRECLSVRRDP